MVDLYEILKKLEISYEEVEHEAVFTMEDIKKLDEHLEGMQLKNLFVKDRFDNRYLIVVDEEKRVDLKALKENLNLNKLSFCKEDELMNILKITSGAVTPLAVVNDKEKEVIVILDEDMIDKDILVHPLVNTKTMKLNYKDLIKLFDNQKTNYIISNIPLKEQFLTSPKSQEK